MQYVLSLLLFSELMNKKNVLYLLEEGLPRYVQYRLPFLLYCI